MILPIFITNQYLSTKAEDKDSKKSLVNLWPIEDPFYPPISNSRIREMLKNILNEDDLKDIEPVILSIADENYDVEPTYDFVDITESIPFAVIVPEYYYPKAIMSLPQDSANIFFTCKKYGIDVPEDIRILIDSIAVRLYAKENVGKFISQSQIFISTYEVDVKSQSKYIEAMVAALSDGIQIAGVWSIFIDFEYSMFPNLIESLEKELPMEEFFETYGTESHGKLIIAPGAAQIEIGEEGNFEKVELTDTSLNKFKLTEDAKMTFKWKSDKSKFDGEICGSKTGIKVDVRERPKQK